MAANCDVCGKGPEAASVTALARHTLRAAAAMWEGTEAQARLIDGGLAFDDSKPTVDRQHVGAPIVLEDGAWIGAGAIILAKATLGELGGGDTHGSLFGSTRNPYDTEREPGMSSAGSASSAASCSGATSL